jgi:hypothetical protein
MLHFSGDHHVRAERHRASPHAPCLLQVLHARRRPTSKCSTRSPGSWSRNVIVATATRVGPSSRLEGLDDQCSAARRATFGHGHGTSNVSISIAFVGSRRKSDDRHERLVAASGSRIAVQSATNSRAAGSDWTLPELIALTCSESSAPTAFTMKTPIHSDCPQEAPHHVGCESHITHVTTW